jgi:hypothetical protein
MDLALAIGPDLDRPGGADQVSGPGQWPRPQTLANVDRGQPRQGNSLPVEDHEVGVAVAVGIDPLDVDDPPLGGAAGGVARRAMRGRDRLRVATVRESAKSVAIRRLLRFRRLLVRTASAHHQGKQQPGDA